MSDAARLAWGLPAAAILPAALPQLRTASSGWVSVIAGGYGLVTLSTVLPEARAWVLLGITVGTSILLHRELSPSSADAPGGSVNGSSRAVLTVMAASLPLAAASALAADSDATWRAIDEVVSRSEVSVVASGGLLAVFGGGLLIGRLLTPYAAALESSGSSQLANAGTYIGWCERAILFALVVGGEPQAAAIALAAKSFARFPSLAKGDEAFAEYFLIGTLLSVLVALTVAIGVRAAIGLPAL